MRFLREGGSAEPPFLWLLVFFWPGVSFRKVKDLADASTSYPAGARRRSVGRVHLYGWQKMWGMRQQAIAPALAGVLSAGCIFMGGRRCGGCVNKLSRRRSGGRVHLFGRPKTWQIRQQARFPAGVNLNGHRQPGKIRAGEGEASWAHLNGHWSPGKIRARRRKGKERQVG